MTRRYWAGVMFSSLVVTLGAGYFTWTSLKEKAVVDVPLTAVKAPQPEIPPAEVTSENVPAPENSEDVNVPNVSEKTSEGFEKKVEEASVPIITEGHRNILFTYRKASANDVALIGSFNNWKREPMKKNNQGLWEIAVQLKPGFYEYKYVVDGRRIKDPNNRLYTPAGNSILKVKPLDH